MECLTRIPFTLDLPGLLERMHIRPEFPEADTLAELVETAERIGRPKAAYVEAYVDARDRETVTIGGAVFHSAALSRNLEGRGRVFPFVATCGAEMEEKPFDPDDFLAAYWWDAIRGDLLESARRHLQDRLERRYRLGVSASMSPGSGDAHIWPIEEQRRLFELLGDLPGAVGVTLTESCLMLPVKTVSGIRFAAERDFRTCAVCRRGDCPERSAPFDRALWESLR